MTTIDKMSNVVVVTAAEFRRLRTSIGYSQSMLAKEMEITIRTITRWENEEVRIPKVAELALRFISLHAQGREKQ